MSGETISRDYIIESTRTMTILKKSIHSTLGIFESEVRLGHHLLCDTVIIFASRYRI